MMFESEAKPKTTSRNMLNIWIFQSIGWLYVNSIDTNFETSEITEYEPIQKYVA